MFKSDRKIMYPSDIDRLISLIKTCVDARDAIENISPTTAPLDAYYIARGYSIAKMNLAEFIVSLDVEVLDLISRGRSDISIREYTQVNGRFVPYAE